MARRIKRRTRRRRQRRRRSRRRKTIKRRKRRTRRLKKGGYNPEKDSCYQQLGDTCCFYSVRTAVEVALNQKLSSLIKELKEKGSFRKFAVCPKKKYDEGAENLDTTFPKFMEMFPKIAELLHYERVPQEVQRRGTRNSSVSNKLFPNKQDILSALKEGYVIIMLLQNYALAKNDDGTDTDRIIPYQLKEGETKGPLFNGHCITCIDYECGGDLIFLDTNKEKESCIKRLDMCVLNNGITAVTNAKGLDAPTLQRQHLYIQEMWKLKKKDII